MAWRVLEVGGTTWNVSLAAERHPNTERWSLVLSFRSSSSGAQTFWAPYPLESSSRSALYSQAESLADAELKAVLAEHLKSR